jgi:hypothetical protein
MGIGLARVSCMRLATRIAQGLVAGASGAGCMTALRMAARRAGWIDATPPQATQQWMTDRVGLRPQEPGSRQLIDSIVHLVVGVAGGAAYGGLFHPTRLALTSGALFGLGVWALAFGVLAPGLGITRSPRRSTWRETAVNVAAHLVYGTATALVTLELGGQTHAPGAGARALRARVG